ncbi:MAG: cation diffusion facilitator family transporter [Bacillus sp. (in: firmicutes)]
MFNNASIEHIVQRGAWISIFAYLFMASIKLTMGYYGNSEGLWADGLNNSTDIIASIAVLIGMKISAKPADDDHLYGHTRAETVASLIAAFIMMTVGITVIFDAFQSLMSEESETPSLLSAFTAAFSFLFMFGVYQFNKKLSQRTKSASLNAIAKDNLSDSLVSAGALVGIIGTMAGLPWLDVAAAIIVGFIICKTAWDIFSEASHSLTDGFDQHLLTEIRETIQSIDSVYEVSDLKGRMHGNDILVEATIQVCPILTVVEGHEISDHVEKALHEQFNIQHALIHIEPYERWNGNGNR